MSVREWSAAWRDRLYDHMASRPGARSFGANSLWLVFDRVVRAVLALTVGAWVARSLGPSTFGEYTYAITFVALFLGLANLGADGLVVRDLSRTPQRAEVLLGTTMGLRLAAGLLCWPLATVAVFLLRPGDDRSWQLVALVGFSLVLQSAETINLWLQSNSQNRLAVSAKLIASIVGNLIRVGMVWWEAPLWALAFSVALDAVLTALALCVAYRRRPCHSAWRFEKAAAVALLREAWPFMLSGVAVLIYMRIDQLMIRDMLGEEALGLYSSALSVSQMWYFLPVALCTALAPHIARKKQEDHAAYMRALGMIFRMFAVGAIVLSIGTTLLSESLIRMLYGGDYASAAPVLAVHVWSNLFVFLGVAQGLWLVNEGLGRLTLYRTVLGAISSVVGNLLLIPPWGLMGAAVATVVAMLMADVVSNAVFAPQILRMQFRAFLPIGPGRRAG